MLFSALALLSTVPAALAQDVEPVWDERSVEHLFNRAGFGARPVEIRSKTGLPQEELVAAFLEGFGQPSEPFFAEDVLSYAARREMGMASEEERKAKRRQYRRNDTRQLLDFTAWWVAEMLYGEHPLRERMTLFWHGYFTSSARDVKSSVHMIEQNELFRQHALGNFRELAHAIVRDPAMLKYLDNDKNQKKAPNENLARELMELFTLGEGNYDEADVKEAARALTGWTVRAGEFVENRRKHDQGKKTVLGARGRHDADDLVEILLEQDACPRWLAGKLLEYFEGAPPSEERLGDYADWMREVDYDIARFLERLFLDPHFYSDEVVGMRIASPIDYLVGTSRRLGVRPPPMLVGLASAILGEQLFNPPSVKGWDGGRAWISTSTLLQRGNLAGVLVGVHSVQDVLDAEPEALFEADEGEMDGDMAMMSQEEAPAQKRPTGKEFKGLKLFDKMAWRPFVNLTARCQRTGHESPEEVVDFLCKGLLAVEVSETSRASLVAFLEREAEAEGLQEDLFQDRRVLEGVLRRLAHLILSLPEAQLH